MTTVVSSRSQKRPTGLGLFLLASACVILPATAMLVTAVDPQARAATLFAAATPVVLGIAIAIVLVAAIATVTATGRSRPIAGVGLVLAALVFAVVGIGLLTNGPSTMTVGVVLLPAVIGALIFARIAQRTFANGRR